jgi:hypothetical protein
MNVADALIGNMSFSQVSEVILDMHK